MYYIDFDLQGLPMTLNQLLAAPLRARMRHKRLWKRDVFLITFNQRPPVPLKKAHITLTRHSSKECDDDNLRASFKPILDGLKQAKIIEDDKPSVIGSPVCQWRKTPAKQGRITVIVEEIE